MRKLNPQEVIRLKEVKQEIKKEMLLIKIYYKKAKFVCYDSGCFTYNYTMKDGTLIETNFICEDTLLDKLSFQEILNLRDIKFLWQRIFDIDSKLIGDITFRLE
jgi:hypothetical protein